MKGQVRICLFSVIGVIVIDVVLSFSPLQNHWANFNQTSHKAS